MACALRARIGIWPPVACSCRRIASVAIQPSLSGICTSIRTKSKVFCLSASTAARPVATVVMQCPRFSSSRVASFWFMRLFSASRIERCRSDSETSCRAGGVGAAGKPKARSIDSPSSVRETGLVMWQCIPRTRQRGMSLGRSEELMITGSLNAGSLRMVSARVKPSCREVPHPQLPGQRGVPAWRTFSSRSSARGPMRQSQQVWPSRCPRLT